MVMAVRVNQIAAAIGRQHIIEETIRVIAVCRHLEADPVDPTIAAALFSELLLHILEEVVIRIPSLGNVLHLIAGLLYQRTPDVVYPSALIIGYQIAAALFSHIVVAIGRRQRGGCGMVSLGVHNVADIHQLVVPRVKRADLVIAETIFWRIGANGIIV